MTTATAVPITAPMMMYMTDSVEPFIMSRSVVEFSSNVEVTFLAVAMVLIVADEPPLVFEEGVLLSRSSAELKGSGVVSWAPISA